MSRDDWYRRKTWTSKDEFEFFAKLKRARDKCQYLRIQACYLTNSHPVAALALLDQYFKICTDHFDLAQAYVDKANAFHSMGRLEDAVGAYMAALAREEVHPNLKTSAYLDLPFLIATNRLAHHYNEAGKLVHKHHDRMMFPLDYFKFHATLALIADERGADPSAREHAEAALVAAKKDHSGFTYHAKVGLVGDTFTTIRKQLEQIQEQ